jgi:hypothetical protein
MAEIKYHEIKTQIVAKALHIFNAVFGGNGDIDLKDKNPEELESFKLLRTSSQGGSPEGIYKICIEELLSKGELGEFFERVCEEHKFNQDLQDKKNELMSLLKDLDSVASEQKSLESPPVLPNYRIEDVYNTQQNETLPFHNNENSNQSRREQSRFTFNQVVGALMFVTGCALLFSRWLLTFFKERI